MHPHPPHDDDASAWTPVRTLVGGYALVALLALASRFVPSLNALLFVATAVLFAAPAALASWHAVTSRRLVAMHPFRPGHALHWWATRRFFGYLLGAAGALVLAAAVLLQSALFDALDWALLAAAPLLFAIAHRGVAARVQAQFAHPVHAHAWVLRFAHWATMSLLAAIWIVAALTRSAPPAAPLGEAVFEMQQQWAQAPSAIVRWGLDLAAWGRALAESLLHQPEQSPWRPGLAALLTPLALFGYVALGLWGLSLPLPELRRIFAAAPTLQPRPPAVGGVTMALWAALLTVAAMALLQAAALGETLLRQSPASPLAVQRIPECERIGSTVYQLGTIGQVKALLLAAGTRMQGTTAAACAGLDNANAIATDGVDRYLDWYFGLGAEWARIVTMLTGDIEAFLARKFEEIVFRDPALSAMFGAMQRDHQRLLDEMAASGRRLRALMEANKLVLDARQCKVVADLSPDAVARPFGELEVRLATAAGGALAAGAFAAKVTSKAMGKASMKMAGKVLAKALAKKTAGKIAGAAGGAAAGAALGSAVPGPGTVAGAVVGGAVGLAFGTAIDWAMLYAEEKLTRESFRAELLESLQETVAEYKQMLGCR